MLIPYQVDVPSETRPVANWLLVAATVGVFGLELAFRDNPELFEPFYCTGWDNPLGWVTSLFLHAGFFHIIGNMIFLWVFGNAVCAKVGNLMYLPIYLIAGIAGSFAQMTFSDPSIPSLGASGAINGMVGAYLVLFPTNDISCMLLLYIRPWFFTISSYWVILYFLAWDIFGAAIGGGNVGHWAHLGGFTAGLAIAVILLKSKVVKMEDDELSLLQVLRIDKRPEAPEVDVLENEARRLGILTVSREAEAAEELAAVRRKMASSPPPPLEAAPRAQTAAISSVNEPKKSEEVVRFSCTCGKSIKAPARMAGARGKCPRCGETVRIPPKSDA